MDLALLIQAAAGRDGQDGRVQAGGRAERAVAVPDAVFGAVVPEIKAGSDDTTTGSCDSSEVAEPVIRPDGPVHVGAEIPEASTLRP
ncbi:hypothetical protein ACFXPY_29470 [Streptomyces sp. NPDC059153]|uniref:hypothetical protein n=1 Tax=Streptomyces sp. NPDC059153 TaxID=3346743 RepID=UPI0036785A8F